MPRLGLSGYFAGNTNSRKETDVTRILGVLRRLWQREQADDECVPAPAEPPREELTYCFIAPSAQETSLESLVPYRSPQAATFYQYQCHYWEAPYQHTDSLTSWQWLDEHSFSCRYSMRRDYPS